MIREYEEKTLSGIEGTIIDIETIGDFNRLFGNDSRRYRSIIQVIFGYIDSDQLHIYCAEDQPDILKLKGMTNGIIEFPMPCDCDPAMRRFIRKMTRKEFVDEENFMPFNNDPSVTDLIMEE